MFSLFKKCDHKWIVSYQEIYGSHGFNYSVFKSCSICGKKKNLMPGHYYVFLFNTIEIYQYSKDMALNELNELLKAIKAQNPEYYVIGIDDKE